MITEALVLAGQSMGAGVGEMALRLPLMMQVHSQH